MGTTSEDEQVIRGVLDRWKAGVDAHEPAEVAGCFTEDAIFQGMRPYSVGRQGVTDYYASQPMGMRAAYKVLETRRLAEGLVLGVVGSAVGLGLGIVVAAGLKALFKAFGASPTMRTPSPYSERAMTIQNTSASTNEI